MTPEPPTVTASLTGDRLLATIDLPGATPATAVAAFCGPDRLRQWWGGDLTCKLRPVGRTWCSSRS